MDGVKKPAKIKIRGFATAVEAALWYAKHIAGEDPPMPNGEKFRPTRKLAMPRAQWEAQGGAAAAAAAAAQQEGGDAHSPSGQAATPPPVVAWADGVQLHLSPDSDTGYECVARYGPCFVLNSARFRERKRDSDGRLRRRQKFATAQEAAVEYARLVATAPGDLQQQQLGTDADSDQEMSDPDGSEMKAIYIYIYIYIYKYIYIYIYKMRTN